MQTAENSWDERMTVTSAVRKEDAGPDYKWHPSCQAHFCGVWQQCGSVQYY